MTRLEERQGRIALDGVEKRPVKPAGLLDRRWQAGYDARTISFLIVGGFTSTLAQLQNTSPSSVEGPTRVPREERAMPSFVRLSTVVFVCAVWRWSGAARGLPRAGAPRPP